MAIVPNTITTQNFTTLQAKEIDFIERFQRNWESLIEILGIMRPIRKMPGTRLVSSTITFDLKDGNISEGEEVPLSSATITPVKYEDIVLQKFQTKVTAESILQYGADIAVQKTDDAFINELQGKVLDKFYQFAQTGTLTASYDNFQMAVAMSVALVKDKFKKIRRDYSNVIVFANTLDVGQYLGNATISTQTLNGMEYLKNFLGAETLIVTSEIEQGKVLATPADNIVMYYIDPSDSDLAQAGLVYTISNGATNLIGVHKEGDYHRVAGETHAIYGITLFAEYLDGIAVVTTNGATPSTAAARAQTR